MNIHEKFNELCQEYGLTDWELQFSKAAMTNGTCHYDTRTIVISQLLINTKDEMKILNTLTHEIAHAIVGGGHGHDDTWKAMHIKLGGNGQRCSDNDLRSQKAPLYVAICPNKCFKAIPLYRKVTRAKSCRICHSLIDIESAGKLSIGDINARKD